MREFKVAKPSRLVIDFVTAVIAAELRLARIELFVGDGDLGRFHSMRGKQTVLVCNHPDQYDPAVMFAFSKMVNEDFNFIGAREVFDWLWGAVGWVFQRVGCYSVERGEADHTSFRYTRDVIVAAKNKLVMFPEGEVTRRHDELLPIRPGTARILLQAQEDLQALEPGESIFVLPTAIHWRYLEDVTLRLARALRRIERRLGISSPERDLVKRAYAAGAAMLSALEIEYFSSDHSELDYEERVCKLREHILKQIGPQVDVEAPYDCSQLVWLHRIINAMHQFRREDVSVKSPWQRHLHQEQSRKFWQFLLDCHRLQHLAGVAKPPNTMTPERLVAMVSIIEQEVIGSVSSMGPRIASLAIGQPIAVADYAKRYDGCAALDALTNCMTTRLQRLLDELDRASGDAWELAFGAS